jgi:hypothetical protein
MVKTLRPVKTWRMVKTLRPVKTQRMVKTLCLVKTRDGKNLAPIKILAPGEISASMEMLAQQEK